MFDGQNKILSSLSTDIKKDISPDGVDGKGHNAFYYAIRSENVELLDTLINKWPDDYFATHSKKLDDILARAYDELKLKNVPLSEEIEVFVQDKLINLRFFYEKDSSKSADENQPKLEDIKKRIDIVIDGIDSLEQGYSGAEEVDGKFLYSSTFIAKNIRILKRQLPFTYDELPWEEIEFSLTSFVSSYTKDQEINFVFKTILNKQKLLDYLSTFKDVLSEQKNILEDKDLNRGLPNIQRRNIVDNIIDSNPTFSQLYDDHEQMRDIYSLKQLEHYVNLILSDNINDKIKQQVIERALQVTGEYLKSTLTSPNMSSTLSGLIIQSVSKSTSQILKGLRNSLSHSYSLANRMEIAKLQDPEFLSHVQNDLKKIGAKITDIFYKYKVKMVKILLERIANSDSLDEIKGIAKALEDMQFDKINLEEIKIKEHENIKKLIEDFDNQIKDKTDYQKELFSKINDIFGLEENKLINMRVEYLREHSTLEEIIRFTHIVNINTIKTMAQSKLKDIVEKDQDKQEEIIDLVIKISGGITEANNDLVNKLVYDIFYTVQFALGKTHSIEEFKEKLERNRDKNARHTTIEEKQAKLDGILDKILKEKLNLKEGGQIIKELRSKSRKDQERFSDTKEKLLLILDELIDKRDKGRQKIKSEIDENYVKDLINRSDLEKKEKSALKNDLTKKKNWNKLINKKKSIENLCGKITDLAIRKYIINIFNKLITEVEENRERVKKKAEERYIEFECLLNSLQLEENDRKLITDNYKSNNWDGGKNGVEKLAGDYEKLVGLIDHINQDSVNKIPQLFNKFSQLLTLNDNQKENLNESFKKEIEEILKSKAVINQRLSALESILDENELNSKLIEKFSSYKGDQKLQAVVEMLVLDVTEILNAKRLLAENRYFLDKPSSILVGKQLRNYLAHGDSLVNALSFNSLMSIISNAKTLVKEKDIIIGSEKLIGQPIANDPSGLAEQHKQNLDILSIQKEMFSAAEGGDIEKVKSCIKIGADINARDINGWSVLHYAARGDKLDVIKFFLSQNLSIDTKNNKGDKPLHIAARFGSEKIIKSFVKYSDPDVNYLLRLAAENGRKQIVEILLSNKGAEVNAKDDRGWTSLHVAVQNGHNEVVDALLSNGAEVNAKDDQGLTPLHLAADRGHNEVVDALLSKGGEVNAKTTDQDATPLHFAAQNGHSEVVEALLSNGAEVNAKTTDKGLTPLHFAADKGHKQVVEALLSNGAEVNAKATYQGLTPLHYAAQNGHNEVVDALLSNGADVNAKTTDKGVTPLHSAAQNGNKEVVDVLLSNGAEVNAKTTDEGLTPLHFAAGKGHNEIVDALLSNGAEVNAKTTIGWIPLHYAAKDGHNEVADALLKANGVGVNAKDDKGFTPLHYAALYGNKKVVEALLKANGVDVNVKTTNEGETPLHFAALSGHKKVVEALLKANGVDVNAKANQGLTPLHFAADKGHNEVVDALLSKGAEVNAKTTIGWTPLHYAAQKGHNEVVDALLKANGIDVNAKINQGWTPLHFAADKEVVEALLSNGADVNPKTTDNLTPLHFAALDGHKDVVVALLSKGAEVNAKDTDQGSTPLHYAAQKGHLETVKYLIDEGADVLARNNHDTVLHRAASSNNKEVIELILNKIREGNENIEPYINAPDNEGDTPLMWAAENGKTNAARVLLEYGMNINVPNNNGETALHWAAKGGYQEITQLLLYKQANPNIKDKNGKAPLDLAQEKLALGIDDEKFETIIALLLSVESEYTHHRIGDISQDSLNNELFSAIEESNFQKIKDCVRRGADINAVDKNNQTLLHFLATVLNDLQLVKHLKYLKYLIEEKRADFKITDNNGWTPLHRAACNGNLGIVKYLVGLLEREGGSLNSPDNDGYTPLHWAAYNGKLDVVTYLIKKGTNPNTKNEAKETPLDLVQEKLAQDPENENLKTIANLLLSRTNVPVNSQQIQSNKKQQKSFVKLNKHINSNFPEAETKLVKQGLYLSSFESRNVKIDGKCAAITRIFSQGLFLGQQGETSSQVHESFLSNLQTSAELYERLAQGQQISSREEKEIFALSKLLNGVEEEVISPTSSLPSSLSHIKSYKTLDDLSHYVGGFTEDFAIHLVTSNHVVAIYRTGETYTYFDSNVALVSDLKSVDQLMKVVEKGVSYAAYELAEEGFLIEHFDVAQANNALTDNQKEILTKPIQTERHLLSLQDQEHGLITMDNGQEVSRVELYDMGAKLQVEGSTPVLINSQMSSEDLTQNLNSGKIKITAREYLQNLKGNKKEVVQDLVQAMSSLPFDGSANEVKDAETVQNLVLSADGQMLNSYQLNKILKGPIEQSIKALPYYMEVANTKHWPNRLTNAAGRISMAKGFYDIAHSIRYGDTEGFLLGSGEIGFSLFSQLIEDGVVKLAPQVIKQMKHGIFLTRGFAGLISSPFDIYDLVSSSIDLANSKKGSKEWRDSIAGVVFSGSSVATGMAFTALGKPGVGTVVGLGIIIGQGLYSGTSMVIEYKKYKLTTNQEFRLFWHTFALQLPPEDVQYLSARKDVVNKLAEQAWEFLQNNTHVAAYGMGLGEIRFVDDNHSRSKRMIDDMEQSITGAKLRNDVYVHNQKDLEEAIKELLPKPKTVEVEPSSASIGMTDPNNERNGQHLSRIVPVSPSSDAQMLCLPQFTHRDYEYDNSFGRKPMYSNSPTAIYHCHNAIIVGRKNDTIENPTMVFDLSLVNGNGIIVSSSKYRNQFNIAQGGTKIYGSNYTSNVFTLTNDNFFGTVIGGTANATNVLDVSQLKSKGLSYENNIITTQEAQLTAQNIDHFIGREGKAEHVNCKEMNDKMMVNGHGGSNQDNDVVSNCKQVVITSNTKVVSDKLENTFYIKPSAGYAEIRGKGSIVFSDTALLQRASSISYSAANNTLSLQVDLEHDISQSSNENNSTFTLDIYDYLDERKNHNYVIIDKYGSVIEPLIQPNSTHFNLKAEINSTNRADVAKRYQEISQVNGNYTVYGVVRDSEGSNMIFGSEGSDIIPLTQNVTFAQGNKKSDVYSLMPEEKVNVTINNYDEKKAPDVLYLPMNATWAEAEKVENDLHIFTSDATINVENYFRNSSYRHLIVIDQDKNTFLPWSNNQSHVQLVPFFHATKDQYMFLLSAAKVKNNPEVIVDAKLDDIRFYRYGNDLMLMDDQPLIVKVESFYSNQYGNFTLNFRSKEKLSSKQLSELAKIAINYQDEVRNAYYDSFNDYTVSTANATIHHNQRFINGSLTTVEPNDKRVGILSLQDPADIEVSVDNNDLVFFAAQSNATFIIKNWNNTDHRISMLKFGDELEVRGVDKFDLSEVSEIQAIINKAAISNALDERLEKLDNEVVNGLKYLLASNGIVNGIATHSCLGFESREDQQEFVAAYSTLYSKDKLQQVLQDSQVVEALIWLIAKGHTNLSLKDPDKEKDVLLKDLDQCFNVVIDKRIVVRLVRHLENGNEVQKVERFIRNHQVALKQHHLQEQGYNITTEHQRSRRAIYEKEIHVTSSNDDHEFFVAQNNATFVMGNDGTSSAARTPPLINDLFGWVKSSIGVLFNSRAALPENNTTQSSLPQVDAQVNVDGTIMLLDLLIRKVTGQKHIPLAGESVSLLEAQGNALNITTKFEQVLNETAVKSGISVTNLNFNPVPVSSAIAQHLRNDKFSEIAKTLYSSAEKACPEFKQTDKFLARLKNSLEDVLAEKETVLLQQKVGQASHSGTSDRSISQLHIQEKAEPSEEPRAFLNGTAIAKRLSYAEKVRAEDSRLKNGVRIG